ncbi:M15 family metallopeptidase [Lactiplantibacillus sp. WILCCON 0030]|uniref:M15 family metallopeptidase n=1 Tax=Lactiplantibacillus brownii TaxID=3069269 RepID=A0ABU1A798_9LACO|nr:M15 family metallopeptidase [Lactiplantibacillus brownii]MDQ7936827.1 M15 family metallopeptidase [Lactiplantibacillus brownii]
MKKTIVTSMVLIALTSLLGGCSTNLSSSSTLSHSSKTAKTQTKRQKLISALPKGVRSTDSDLIVVNKWHQHNELNFSKATVKDIPVRETIVKPLTAFLKGAQAAGYPATLVSGYRSVDYQETVWNQSIKTYEAKGKSAKQALKLTKEFVAVPRGSEHQTGLAVDVMNTKWYDANDSQLLSKSDQTAGQQWLIKHAPEYGFVLRFTKTGKASTGIGYESWHFRYVGKKSAAFMTKHNLTLEQYVSLLKAREKVAK